MGNTCKKDTSILVNTMEFSSTDIYKMTTDSKSKDVDFKESDLDREAKSKVGMCVECEDQPASIICIDVCLSCPSLVLSDSISLPDFF
jgi:hypothetical protein